MTSIFAAIEAVRASAETLNKLSELTNKMKNIELKTTIAQLANDLADAGAKLAELKMEMNALREENLTLKGRVKEEKPKHVYGCFQFDGDTTLYCPGCFASKGLKAPTTRLDSRRRRCSVCQAELGSS